MVRNRTSSTPLAPLVSRPLRFRSQPTSADRRLVKGLQDLKRQMDEEHFGQDAFSFTKIILKLGTIEEVLRRVKVRRRVHCTGRVLGVNRGWKLSRCAPCVLRVSCSSNRQMFVTERFEKAIVLLRAVV